ncbi:MAG: hypothetical protein K0S01_4021 [Herbinix sp.]|jgi:HPt (histidine-containing phosphotransfer) domain-containing protein|nr:hypothetical protein [Herbinix sp.]
MEHISSALIGIGVDVNSVLSRLGGNEVLYLNICRKFLKDKNYQSLQDALAEKDLISANIYLHTLKGVAANLGFVKLELLCKNIMENIKNNELEYIHNKVNDLSKEYKKIIEIFNEEKTL